jgi:hypothetical protein
MRKVFFKVFFTYSHNLVKVYIKCNRMRLYMFKSQFVSVTQKSGLQGLDYERGYCNFIVKNYMVLYFMMP